MASIGNTRYNWAGSYDAVATYKVNDIVEWHNHSFVCIQDTTAGTDPSTTANWTKFAKAFRDRGDWDNSSTYEVDDVVIYYDRVYTANAVDYTNDERRRNHVPYAQFICVDAHTGAGDDSTSPLDDNTKWQILVNHGFGHTSSSTYDRFLTGGDQFTTTLRTGDAPNNFVNTPDIGGYNGCLILAGHGLYGDRSIYRTKGWHDSHGNSYRVKHWITRNGSIKGQGDYTSSNSCWRSWGRSETAAEGPAEFYDWWRSSDNGGTGIHTTPDGKPPRAIQMEHGYGYTMALFNNGEVYHWGYGGHGQTGDGSNSNRNSLYRVGGSRSEVFNNSNHVFGSVRIAKIATSGGGNDDNTHHCMGLDEDGQVWTWGYNGYGQLGHGDTSNRNRPTQINQSNFNNRKIVDIYCWGNSYGWSMAIDDTGVLYAWGRNNYGQLGDGTTSQRNSPVEVSSVNWANEGGIVKIHGTSANDYHSVGVLTGNGNLFVGGYNGYGILDQSNNNNQNAGFVQVQNGPGSDGTCENFWMGGGRYASMFQLHQTLDGDVDSGKLYATGRNNYGQLGIGNTSDTNVASLVTYGIYNAAEALVNTRDVQWTMNGNSDTNNCVIVDNNGLGYCSGYANYGSTSIGYSSTYHNVGDPSGVEGYGTYVFQMMRMPPGSKLKQVRGFGYTDNWPEYMYLTENGRVMFAGRGDDRNQGSFRSDYYSTMHNFQQDGS